MKALVWCDTRKVRIEEVPDPKILTPHDAIVRITSTAICGSDLHLYGGFVSTLMKGDILGHEFMGEVVEVGSEVRKLRAGDRVVVPFTISCGHCYYCENGMYPMCDNSNPNGWMSEKALGYPVGAIFGYSHLYGGFAGGQAEYVRVPFADVGPLKLPQDEPDEKFLFLSDIFPTGYQAAEWADIRGGETVAVWGCGPVGQFAMKSARLLGAGRVIGIDRIPERLELAQRFADAEILNYEEVDDVVDALKDMTGGHGPDRCIDAVGMEAHGTSLYGKVERMKQATMLHPDRASVLRECIRACRKGGTVSVPGVYIGLIDKFPFGVAFAKQLTLRGGQTNMQKLMPPLLERIQRGDLDPSMIITHRLPLEQAAEGYKIFRDKEDCCIKVVLKTGHNGKGGSR
jgi:threonine dehydrogenase-like Zn-dependent dehydrogenase